MAEKILMTALSPTMENGVLGKWLKKEGDKIEEGDVICQVETDKASVDYEATFSGTLLKIVLKEGSSAKVGETIGIFGKPGEDFSSLLSSANPVLTQTATKSASPSSNEKFDYDVVVIGSGPGGYVSAIRASQLGLKVAIVEKDREGGVCLNWGCIPTKALIHQAEIFNYLKESPYLGFEETRQVDYEQVYKKSRDAADKLNRGVIGLLKKNKVTVFKGFGKLKDKNHVIIEGENPTVISTKNILLAMGSRPKQIPGFEFDEEKVLSSTGFLQLKKLPKKILIMGAGVVGIEIGFILNSFGVEVIMIEMLPNIIPNEDQEAVKVLEDYLTKHGVKLLKETAAKKLTKTAEGVELEIEHKDSKKEILKAEKLMVSVGRSPNTEGMNLEQLGVKIDPRGGVVVKDYYETDVPGVYAIGDIVLSTPLLAHVASKEGEIAVEHMAGINHEKKIDINEIPSAIYTIPEIASFGLNEKALKENGVEYDRFLFPYIGIGKTVAIEKPQGFVKIICAKKTREILSAVIVGNSATEMIHEILLAKKAELLPEDIAMMIHAHPTISEGVMESARGLEGWAIHI